MSEYLKPAQPEIVWPQEKIVEVPSGVDFVYIMRKDADFSVMPIANSIGQDSKLDHSVIKKVLFSEYDCFVDRTANALMSGFSAKGLVQIHMYEDYFLANQIKERTDSHQTVSLDPLYSKGVLSFKVSRCYLPGGIHCLGQVARPGAKSLLEQAIEIKRIIGNHPICIVEDDVFLGGSLIEAVNNLISADIKIKKCVPGIQVGNPLEIYQKGILVDPVVKYVAPEGVDIFSKVDLGDPRDFLIGADGLVIKLPNGDLARAPYILPFVSTNARAGIVDEIKFGLEMLDINLLFYQSVEQKIETPILLKHLNPNFMQLMTNLYGVRPETPIIDIITWAKTNYEQIWILTKNLGDIQKELGNK